ncbi:MAG: Phosphoribosyltransferase [Candidatus Daviesbacteria bacterium GW2011_GWA1_38_7]|nr:MAG: Phosphoribosyltransferase [Candidatus Daviesbacteria bacterium GW2011_GWA1_38_7]
MLFDNRQQAGKALARRLKEYNRKNTVVLSLPRGGVPVGFEIAKVLGAPLDVLVARKVSPPGNPEFGIAAVSESGVRVIDENTVDFLGISPEELEELIYAEFAQVRLRIQKYRAGKNLPKLRGKTVC